MTEFESCSCADVDECNYACPHFGQPCNEWCQPYTQTYYIEDDLEPERQDFDTEADFIQACEEFEAQHFNCGQCLPCVGWGTTPHKDAS